MTKKFISLLLICSLCLSVVNVFAATDDQVALDNWGCPQGTIYIYRHVIINDVPSSGWALFNFPEQNGSFYYSNSASASKGPWVAFTVPETGEYEAFAFKGGLNTQTVADAQSRGVAVSIAGVKHTFNSINPDNTYKTQAGQAKTITWQKSYEEPTLKLYKGQTVLLEVLPYTTSSNAYPRCYGFALVPKGKATEADMNASRVVDITLFKAASVTGIGANEPETATVKVNGAEINAVANTATGIYRNEDKHDFYNNFINGKPTVLDALVLADANDDKYSVVAEGTGAKAHSATITEDVYLNDIKISDPAKHIVIDGDVIVVGKTEETFFDFYPVPLHLDGKNYLTHNGGIISTDGIYKLQTSGEKGIINKDIATLLPDCIDYVVDGALKDLYINGYIVFKSNVDINGQYPGDETQIVLPVNNFKIKNSAVKLASNGQVDRIEFSYDGVFLTGKTYIQDAEGVKYLSGFAPGKYQDLLPYMDISHLYLTNKDSDLVDAKVTATKGSIPGTYVLRTTKTIPVLVIKVAADSTITHEGYMLDFMSEAGQLITLEEGEKAYVWNHNTQFYKNFSTDMVPLCEVLTY